MENKQTQIARRTQLLRVKKWLKYQALSMLLLMAFFAFVQHVFAVSSSVIINEIQISGGSGKTSEDYIELYNNSDKAIKIGGWKLRKRVQSGTESSIRELPAAAVIPAAGYFLWSNTGIKEKVKADESTSSIISANNSIAIFDDVGKIIDQVAWGSGHTQPFIEGAAFIIPIGQPERIQRKSFQDTGNNADDFEIAVVASPTPSGCLDNPDRCAIKDESEESKIYSDKLQITELLPDPADGDDEYIELYNGSGDKIDLENWSLHDASKTGEYIFSATDSIQSKKYLAIYGDVFKFALNNSGDENVTLFDPNKKEVFKVSYNGSKKGISYNFDADDWHWSKFLTPGKENIFEKVPAGELAIDDDVYVDVYANFEILGLSEKAKVDWDFGDGHGSTLQKTRHKYAEVGKYAASVKYSDGSEDVTQNFTVDVSEVPHPAVKIVVINANPVGSDTDLESLTILNKSKKKINLNGWSIATGWKKLSNHPISQDFEIKAGKEKEITREFSKFTLNNQKAKIELRYPDGEVAYDVKYKSEKGIGEGEIYVKGKKEWIWVQQETKTKQPASTRGDDRSSTRGGQDTKNTNSPAGETIINNQTENINQKSEVSNQKLLINNQIMEDQIGMQTKVKRNNQLAVNSNNLVKIELLSSNRTPRVLGAETVREIDGIYHFTPQYPAPEHYAVTFFKNIFALMNARINLTLNFFFE